MYATNLQLLMFWGLSGLTNGLSNRFNLNIWKNCKSLKTQHIKIRN